MGQSWRLHRPFFEKTKVSVTLGICLHCALFENPKANGLLGMSNKRPFNVWIAMCICTVLVPFTRQRITITMYPTPTQLRATIHREGPVLPAQRGPSKWGYRGALARCVRLQFGVAWSAGQGSSDPRSCRHEFRSSVFGLD